jgi:hypothetical protein
MTRWRAESKAKLTTSTRSSRPSKARRDLSVLKALRVSPVLKGLKAIRGRLALMVRRVFKGLREIPVTLGRKVYKALRAYLGMMGHKVPLVRMGRKVFKASKENKVRRASRGRRENRVLVVGKRSRLGACS